MKPHLFLFLIISFFSLSTVHARLPGEGLTGGDYSTSIPYQAFLRNGNQVICGATIISEYWLLSAAHCFVVGFKTMTVITGTSYANGYKGTKHAIDRIITHRNFNLQTRNNDIALIKVKRPIEFTVRQYAIRIATRAPQPGEIMTISGYGRESDGGQPSQKLKKADVPVVSREECSKRYGSLTPSMFCAGRGRDAACQGDSGGPGVIHDRLAGIISAGRHCGSPFFPGIYTRVDLFRDWIRRHVDVD